MDFVPRGEYVTGDFNVDIIKCLHFRPGFLVPGHFVEKDQESARRYDWLNPGRSESSNERKSHV
jgi:hypothetical protein